MAKLKQVPVVEKESNLPDKNSNHKNQENPTSNEGEGEDKPKLSSGLKEEFILRYLESGDPSILPYGYDPNMVHGKYNVWTHWTSLSSEPRLVLLDKSNSLTASSGVDSGMAQEIGKTALDRILHGCLKGFDDPEYASSAYCFSSTQRKSLAATIFSSGRAIKDWPKAIGFKSTPGYCFKRHDFDPAERATPKDFPTINLNLKHMTNDFSFCQRIGSLFDPTADRKQIFFLLGDGDGGKSAIVDLLTFIAGGKEEVAAISMSVYKEFGLDPLLDKRVWYGEELPERFFKQDKFKILTGGTAVQINRKKERQFNAYLGGMLFCTANKPPELTDDSGLRNRLIFCELDPIPKKLRKKRHETSRLMRAELPYFIRYCMDAYKLVGDDGTIEPETTERLESLIEEAEVDCKAVFDTYLEEDTTKVGKDAVVSSERFRELWEQITEENKAFARETKRKKFNEYVAKRLGRKEWSTPVHGKDGRWVPGVVIKKRNVCDFSVISKKL